MLLDGHECNNQACRGVLEISGEGWGNNRLLHRSPIDVSRSGSQPEEGINVGGGDAHISQYRIQNVQSDKIQNVYILYWLIEGGWDTVLGWLFRIA